MGLALLASACGGSDEAAKSKGEELAFETTTSTTATPPTTVTTEPELPGTPAPLTGVRTEDVESLARPALIAKIDNAPSARPQVGLDGADLVFDYRAEGVTRFAAVFHSNLPETIGPVRSSRTADFDIIVGFNKPIYASSGGNDYVMNGLRSLPIQAMTAQSRNEYFRDNSRPAPHNLFVHPEDLVAAASSDSQPPTPWFDYRPQGADVADGSVPVEGPVTVNFTGGPKVGFTWDPAEGWLRTQGGAPHTTADGVQISPDNVVILVTSYRVSSADSNSPEVVSVGSGEMFVLTDGHIIAGTWKRASATEPLILVDNLGSPVLLTPGQTWILWPESGQVDLGL